MKEHASASATAPPRTAPTRDPSAADAADLDASTRETLAELRRQLAEINNVDGALSLLDWDQATYMPRGGGPARARQLGSLGRIVHGLRTSPALADLLARLRPLEERLPPDAPEAALVREARRDFERASRVPTDLAAAFREHGAATFSAWMVARPANDFASMRPYLERTLELSRRYADLFPEHVHPIDALMEEHDRGTTLALVRSIFEPLKPELVALRRAIAARPAPDDSFLYRDYPAAAQLDFVREIVSTLGYDFERGRLDLTHHPFMTKTSLGDVRITTRVDERNVERALFSSIHECGHALYEQGIALDFEATPLAHGTSAAVHESQSRLWENLVGRSRPFWRHFFSSLAARFPEALGGVDAEAFYRAINKVEPSLVRVEADEVTYNLHVMIRFDLEVALLEGRLAIADLPDAWNARYRDDLGVEPPDDRLGVLQDVHWYSASIGGYFQSYTLGNVMSAQLFDAACAARPEIVPELESARFDALLGWLRENVHRHGAAVPPLELIERTTGKRLGIESFVRYLRTKFGDLYGV